MYERFTGLDLAARTISFCEVRDGKVVSRATVHSLKALMKYLGPNTPHAAVALEAGHGSWHMFGKLTEWGHSPLLVDTSRVKQIGVGHHGKKTDKIDAELLARAVERGGLPAAHVLSPERQRLRHELNVRRTLIETRAELITTVRGLARAHGLLLPTCAAEHFVERARVSPLDERARPLVDPLLRVLDALALELRQVDEKLSQLYVREPAVQRLATVPGVGPVVAAAFVSVVDDPHRFRSADQVASYLGLVPAESSSGGRRKLGAITKAGNTYLRGLLVQSAHVLLRAKITDPVKTWGHAVESRRGKHVAIIALARRYAGILWALFRRGTVYDPELVGLSSAEGVRRQSEATEARADALERAAKKFSNLTRVWKRKGRFVIAQDSPAS